MKVSRQLQIEEPHIKIEMMAMDHKEDHTFMLAVAHLVEILLELGRIGVILLISGFMELQPLLKLIIRTPVAARLFVLKCIDKHSLKIGSAL